MGSVAIHGGPGTVVTRGVSRISIGRGKGLGGGGGGCSG